MLDNEDPYPGYRTLHRFGRIVPSGYGSFLAVAHASVARVVKDPRFELRPPYPQHFDKRDVSNLWAASMNFANGSDHARRRGFMTRAFQPRSLANLVPRMDALLDETFRGFGRRKNVDLVQEFARAFPVRVISEILGVPRDAHAQCLVWAETLAPFVDPTLEPELVPGIAIAGKEFAAFVRALMNERRRAPGTDIISQLTTLLDAQGEISEDEVVANVVALFLAGHETTTSLISTTLVLLQDHPDARADLEAHPELLPSAIEEVLRFESSVQFASRIATEDIPIDGVVVPAGVTVLAMLGAANRDPRVFEDADRFDIRRDPNPHLAFSVGTHVCIGAALARLEGKHALGQFMTQFPRWRVLREGCERRKTVALRSWQHVPVKLR